ncbi:helix-turn-helix domain-containing protein [Paraburkholderia phenazinium]|uniref:AraC-type DNA-binding protein n=1 Tax=Paraburkholderia phenazinium TaxID=60549 RepID=A0A1G8GU03_9BURK|nr:AraC family transcriptional regulator [Paraburkholderia phenazinium]SDH97877.1 AraC-type DNA-binding protein [Paraburkholderia phenazinium]
MLTALLDDHADLFADDAIRERLDLSLTLDNTLGASRRATRPIERAIEFIEASFAQPVTLATLAAKAELSVSRFAALFRAEVGISPHRYVCMVRVRHAQRLLRRGLPPSIVATEVGFFDQSHLGRHFKRTVGTTPSAYLAARS